MTVTNFEDFLAQFFTIFTVKTFPGGSDFLTYLKRPPTRRSNDEAAIVDNAVINPLLSLLGFGGAEQVYNLGRPNGRPDFAPVDPVYGTCFVVEDKNTTLELDFDLSDPESHLSQLRGYVRFAALSKGWLTNGKRLTVWHFDDYEHPVLFIDLDVPAAIREWTANPVASALSPATTQSLQNLFDLYQRANFSSLERIERELALDELEWRKQAQPLGTGEDNEGVLVEALQMLLKELQNDAGRTLDASLTKYQNYTRNSSRLTDDAQELATIELDRLRSKFLAALNANRTALGLEVAEVDQIHVVLMSLEQDARAFVSPKGVLGAILDIINPARKRKYGVRTKAWADFKDIEVSDNNLEKYANTVFAWHQRQATLRQAHRDDITVHDDYALWAALVQETMLGGLDENQRRAEFALQAAYVVFIRLLLIRVCEDKKIFPRPIVSDGGLKHWQEDIERYMKFAGGMNPYSPLLDMAYSNAQNIYAHFFSERELFNWYKLDRQRFIMALKRLSRFNFEGVNSDIVGTIYNTYVGRKEKREKGQYYTPSQIVTYILDEVGYQTGPAIIGSNKKLLDPACGSGSFLVSAAKRLVEAYKGDAAQIEDPVTVLEQVRNSLYGFDLNPFACYLAEVNLLIQLLDLVKLAHAKGQRPHLERFHIYNVDALARPTGGSSYARYDTLLAQEHDEVEQIKSRKPGTPYSNGFAFVVANPPYGATLSDSYKAVLREDWAEVFRGQPDTYVFFMKLGLELLAKNGKFGFITPNTYLMGTNTNLLRKALLEAGRVEQIVDLPQGIWPDVTVDCVLLFLTAESDEPKRAAQTIQVKLLGLRDTLDKLTARSWQEVLMQPQTNFMVAPKYEINIRYDNLLQ